MTTEACTSADAPPLNPDRLDDWRASHDWAEPETWRWNDDHAIIVCTRDGCKAWCVVEKQARLTAFAGGDP